MSFDKDLLIEECVDRTDDMMSTLGNRLTDEQKQSIREMYNHWSVESLVAESNNLRKKEKHYGKTRAN